MDRGGLYRSETRKALSNDEVQALWQAEENGELVCSVYGADEGAPMNANVMTALGSNITVDYDPSASYGFWVPPEELPTASDDMKQDTWDSIDTFDGAHLTVEATFLDGKTESRTYTLSTGRLRLDRYENGTWTVLPQLAGDEEAYVYGIYARQRRGEPLVSMAGGGQQYHQPQQPLRSQMESRRTGENRPQWDRHSSRTGNPGAGGGGRHRDGDRL